MLVVESSMAGGRKEVALAAIAVITTVMQAHGTTKAVSRRYLHTSHSPLTCYYSCCHLRCHAGRWHHQNHLSQVSASSALNSCCYTCCTPAVFLAVTAPSTLTFPRKAGKSFFAPSFPVHCVIHFVLSMCHPAHLLSHLLSHSSEHAREETVLSLMKCQRCKLPDMCNIEQWYHSTK